MFSISFFMKLEIPFWPAFLFPRGHERTNIDSYNYKSKQVDVLYTGHFVLENEIFMNFSKHPTLLSSLPKYIPLKL